MSTKCTGSGMQADLPVFLPVSSPTLLGAIERGAVVAGLVVSFGFGEGGSGLALGVLAADVALLPAVRLRVERDPRLVPGESRSLHGADVETRAPVRRASGLRERLAASAPLILH